MDGEYSRGREATIGPLAEILKKFPDGEGLVLGDPSLRVERVAPRPPKPGPRTPWLG
jgi:hypothetical protein